MNNVHKQQHRRPTKPNSCRCRDRGTTSWSRYNLMAGEVMFWRPETPKEGESEEERQRRCYHRELKGETEAFGAWATGFIALPVSKRLALANNNNSSRLGSVRRNRIGVGPDFVASTRRFLASHALALWLLKPAFLYFCGSCQGQISSVFVNTDKINTESLLTTCKSSKKPKAIYWRWSQQRTPKVLHKESSKKDASFYAFV